MLAVRHRPGIIGSRRTASTHFFLDDRWLDSRSDNCPTTCSTAQAHSSWRGLGFEPKFYRLHRAIA
jgi:hypothetical protein